MEKTFKYIQVGYGSAKGTDSFSVGVEAAKKAMERITTQKPSAVLVFASISYQLQELLTGISSVVGDFPVFGTTTAGEICNTPLNGSVVVIVLASPYLRVRMGMGRNVSTGWLQAVQEAIGSPEIQPYFSGIENDIWSRTTRQGKSIFSLCFSPGNTKHADSRSYEILEELKRLSSGHIPFFGGSSADDWEMETNYILYGTDAYPDSLLVVIFETSLRAGISMDHGFSPSNRRAVATKVSGHEVVELDGKRAADVYAQMLGSDVEKLKGKHLTLTSGQPCGIHDMLDQYRINVASYFTPEGKVRFAQPVTEDTTVTIMEAQSDNLIKAGRETLRKAIVRGQISRPAIALVFSCALRQRILKDDLPKEIESMRSLLPELPIVGFYSFGELGITDSGVSCHANESITVLALGDELTASAEVAHENQRLLKQQRENEAFLEAIVENIPHKVFVKDAEDLRFVSFNKAGEELTGYSREELIGKTDYDFFPKEQADFFTRKDRKVLDIKTLIDIPEEQIKTRYKGNRILHTKKIPLLDENGQPKYLLGISEDITERQKAEEKRINLERQLRQSQKLESIGNLAGGIAHDFNNILSAIIGFTELALDEVERNTTLEDSLQEIYSAGKRARDLVKQILAFARRSDEEIKPIQPSIIAKEVLKLIRSSIPTTIEIRQNIGSDSVIMGNPTQVHQILMNLCTNAAHAMEDEGGILEISLKDVTIDKDFDNKKFDLKHGSYIKIEVTDTGTGIAPEHIHSIFEPYFTTKDPGEGTGMGLAMVHGIVDTYGGKITVDSTLGKGSVFTIYLPIARTRKAQRPYTSEELPLGTERILFVDDEAALAKMGSMNLQSLGYSVITRTSSTEALELFRAKPDEFDLVVTDMTMPYLTGDKLAVALMEIRPDIPVILCTGYSKKISDESAAEIGIKAFAYKPIAKADLAKTVRKVLDEAKG